MQAFFNALCFASVRTSRSSPSTGRISSTCCKPSTPNVSQHSCPSHQHSSNWFWTPSSGPSNTPWGMWPTQVSGEHKDLIWHIVFRNMILDSQASVTCVCVFDRDCTYADCVFDRACTYADCVCVLTVIAHRCVCASPGLQILYTMLQNIAQEEGAAQSFYQTYFCDILQHIFSVVTDTSHTAGQLLGRERERDMLSLMELLSWTKLLHISHAVTLTNTADRVIFHLKCIIWSFDNYSLWISLFLHAFLSF